MSIDYSVDADYNLHAWQWRINKDCARDMVKQKREEYLPTGELPQEAIKSQAMRQFNAYKKHRYDTIVWPLAVFTNFTKSTISAHIGAIMGRKPEIEFSENPEEKTLLDYLRHNADGSGNGLVTIARIALEACEETGGGVFLTLAPDGKASAQDYMSGEHAARIKVFDRENILKREERFIKSNKVLTYIKLREFETYSDESDSQEITKHIEYFLGDDGFVTFKITRDKSFEGYPDIETGDLIEYGKRSTRIPVRWFGAQDNDATIDTAPISAIANLNIQHYKMSARHAEQTHSSKTQYHIDLGDVSELVTVDAKGQAVHPVQVLNPDGIIADSEIPIFTAKGGKVTLLQPEPNTPLAAEPERILEEAKKIGAQIQDVTQAQTATAARIAFGASTATLLTMSQNVSDALREAIRDIASGIGYKAELVKFSLNTKLSTEALTAQDRTSYMSMVQQGVYPLLALYHVLKRANEIPEEMTFDDYKMAIEEDEAFFALKGAGNYVAD